MKVSHTVLLCGLVVISDHKALKLVATFTMLCTFCFAMLCCMRKFH